MYQFGVGNVYGVPKGGNAATPSFPQRFATMQDVSVEFDQKLVELKGQNKIADDVAPSDMTIKGKAAFGNVNVDIYNSLYFGDTVATGTKTMAEEKSTVATNTVTVTHSANFIIDLGVRYSDGSGNLVQVAASPAAGQYTVAAGVYTFNVADNGKSVIVAYVWTNTNGRTLLVTNHLQGYGPVFEMWLSMPYQGGNGLHLMACRSSKMSAPMKRDGYLISDFEFQAFADAAADIFEWFEVTP